MVGITSYGAYVPYFRLARDVIAQAWGRASLRGERAVANHDEDSVTMAVEACTDCLRGEDRGRVDGLFFASTTAPYREKQCSTLVATVLDLRREVLTGDYANSLRAGTAALRAAFDCVKSGSAQSLLVAAADCRLGPPKSDLEQSFGDGATALLLGDSGVIATIEALYSHSDEITNVWRTEEDDFVQMWEERWVLMHGYAQNMREAVTTLLKREGLEPKDFAKAVLYAPDPRAHAGLCRELGFAEAQLQDPLLTTVGNTGSAHALVMLVAALEEAKPGDRILLASYGDGADAFVLQVTEEIEKARERRGVKGHLASKAMLATYAKYLSYRHLIEVPERATLRLFPSATVMWRDRGPVLRLYGSKCHRCSLITFPVQRVCYGCQAKDDYEEVRLSDRPGKLFTYSKDNLAGGIDPPVIQSVVDLEGTRIYCMMTDFEPEEIAVDMPVELTFRRLYEGAGYHNYFWKCRPLRG